jgi:tetratricopeptide (TPR) repeat protein
MEATNNHHAQSRKHDRFLRLQSLLQQDPANEHLARDCIEAALRAGEFGFVADRAQALLSANPSDPRGLFDLASAHIGLREYRAAIEPLQRVLEQLPGLQAARLNLALAHYCLGEFAEARVLLDALYAEGDRSATSLRLLVSSYHHLGLIDEAVALCEANPAPQGADAGLAGAYALAYLDADEAEPAGVWAQRALAQNADSIDGLVVGGTLDILDMQLGRARARFDRALGLASATARAWIGLGTLDLLANDPRLARSHLERGVELMPRHVGSWHVLAWAQLMSNDLDAAEASLQRALELDRNFAETHGGLAAIAALRGNSAAAEQGIEIALRLDEGCLSAQFARSVLIGRQGRSDEARRLIRRTAGGLASGKAGVLKRVLERVTRNHDSV